MLSLIPWWTSAICYGIFSALFMLINQHFKVNPRLLTVYYGFGNFIILFPFMVYMETPDSIIYYILIMLCGLVVFFSDNRELATSSKYGGIVTATFYPIAIPLTTLVWWVLNPATLWNLLKQFDVFLITIICVCIPIVSIFLFNYYSKKQTSNKEKKAITKEALRFFAPCIIYSMLQSILIKYSVGMVSPAQAIIFNTGLVSLVNGMFNLIALVSSSKKELTVKETLKPLLQRNIVIGGSISIVVLTIFAICKYHSLKFAPNPAYVSAINISFTPIITILFNKITHTKDKANYLLTSILLTSSLILILIS